MEWECFLVEKPVPPDERRPGMMWYANWYIERGFTDSLSPNYRRDWLGKRPPVVIVLPDGDLWCPDRCPSWGANVEDGWTVTGDVPRLTATPSIATSGYHGFLRDGMLTDDLDGRKFAAADSQKGGDQKPLTRCAAARDGDCTHSQCPQLRDGEPTATGRHCPLDNHSDED